MRSTFHGLEMAKRALFATQAGLNTVGQNVANANTEGYSRQRVNFATTPSMDFPGLGKSAEAGQLGTGVYTKDIERVREAFLDAQFRNENKTSGEWEVRLDTLDKVQAILNEPKNTGLQSALNDFFNAWDTLARDTDPDKMGSRAVVQQKMISLTGLFNTIDAKLSELDGDIAGNVQSKVGEFNQMSNEVVALNEQIKTLETLGDKANDLRDRRDLLVDKMSNIANVSAKEDTNGVFTLSIGDQVMVNDTQPAVPIAYDPATNTTTPPITSGQIAGMTVSRLDYLKVYRDQLDSLVNGLVQGKVQVALKTAYTFDSSTTTLPFDVQLPPPSNASYKKGDAIPAGGLPVGTMVTFAGLNDLHNFGYTNMKPSSKAGPLFQTADGSTNFTAKNLRVAQPILDDVRNIACSNVAYTDTKGDLQVAKGSSDVAFLISDVGVSPIDFKDGLPANNAILTNGSVPAYFRAMIGQLGAQGQTAQRSVDNQKTLLLQIDNMRQSVSGVNLDEEMTSMIKYQQSYNAAARVVTTVDQMLDTIINRMAAH